MRNVSGFVVLFLASVGIAAAICASVRKSLVDPLDEVARAAGCDRLLLLARNQEQVSTSFFWAVIALIASGFTVFGLLIVSRRLQQTPPH